MDNQNKLRAQTTINVAEDVLNTMDELSRLSGVSRSKLFDLAARHFVSWAQQLTGQQLRLLADATINEKTSGYVRKVSPEEIAAKRMEDTRKALEASEAAISRAMGLPLTFVRSRTKA